MNSVIYQPVLVCNRLWQGIGQCTVKKAFEDMNSSRSPKQAVKIEYAYNELTGQFDLDKPTEILPLSWEYWSQLSPRDMDEYCVNTPSSQLRVPTVIIAPGYDRMPVKTCRPIKRHVYNRYNGRCAYTGDVVPYKFATIDHVIPKSRGGKNDWENYVIASPEANRRKADRTPAQADMPLLYRPSRPKPVIATVTIPIKHPDWKWFLKHEDS